MISEERTKTANTGKWFFFTLVYLILDYGRPQDLFPFLTLRLTMISILVLVFYVILNRGKINFSSPQIKMIWLFILWLAILTPFAVNTRSAYISVQTMLLYMPFILSVTGVVNTVGKLKKLIFVALLLMLYVSIYGLLHRGTGSGNYFQDENDLALYINMWLPFCYFLFLQERSKSRRIIYALCLVVGVLTIVISFSRGGFVGLICMAMIAWWYSPKRILFMMLICILGATIYFQGGDEYIMRVQSVTNTDEGTALTRILTWKSAWAMFLDNPLGVGGNNFSYLFPLYKVDGLEKSMWGRVAHSLWFTLIPELGIPGIVIYLLLLFYTLKDIFFIKRVQIINEDLRYVQALSVAFLASFIGFFVSASFISVLYYAHYWYFVGFVITTASIAKKLIQAKSMVADKAV